MEDVRCLLPFIALNIYPTGGIRQCISGTADLGSLNSDQSLAEIWNSPGYLGLREAMFTSRWPSICRVCREREESGLKSRREIFKDNWQEEFSGGPDIDVKGSVPDIRFLDVAVSNKCNMWCRSCNSDFSSTWEKYESQLSDDLQNSESKTRLGHQKQRKSRLPRLLELLPYCKNLRRLTLKGGEPFFDPETLEFLEVVATREGTKDTVLSVVTNASIVSPRILRILEKFKKVRLSFSIDGSDPVHRYLRGEAFSLDKLARNIRQFRQLPNLEELPILPTVQAYNVLDLENLYQWCRAELDTQPTFYQVLVSPEILHLKVFPVEFRLQIKSFLRSFQQRISGVDSKNAQLIERIIGLLDPSSPYMDLEDNRDAYFERFVRYTKEVDGLRGQSILEVIPQFKSLGVF